MGNTSGMPRSVACRCGTLPVCSEPHSGASRLAEGKCCLVIAAQSQSCRELAGGLHTHPQGCDGGKGRGFESDGLTVQ